MPLFEVVILRRREEHVDGKTRVDETILSGPNKILAPSKECASTKALVSYARNLPEITATLEKEIEEWVVITRPF